MARIKSFGILQTAKFFAVMYFISTGVVMIPMGLLAILFGGISWGREGAFMGILGGGFMLLMPLLYAAVGFVFVALGCWFYNLIARWIGGIELEIVEQDGSGMVSPGTPAGI